MKKFRKLVLTVGALGALAVGGAAFAQAQNSAPAPAAPTQQSTGQETSPGDTDNIQAGDQNESGAEQKDGAESATEQNDGPESASEQNDGAESADQNEGPESASQNDGPGGHHDEAGGAQLGPQAK